MVQRLPLPKKIKSDAPCPEPPKAYKTSKREGSSVFFPFSTQMSSTDCKTCRDILAKSKFPEQTSKHWKLILAFFIMLQWLYCFIKPYKLFKRAFLAVILQTRQIICVISRLQPQMLSWPAEPWCCIGTNVGIIAVTSSQQPRTLLKNITWQGSEAD